MEGSVVMIKAIGSKVWLDSVESLYAIEFRSCVEDLLKMEDVKNLDNYVQHFNTSRLQHSINVAYYSYLVCRKLGFDYRSAARAGILHDLYLYDWKIEKQPEGRHASAHPQIALRNARRIVELNEIEIDAIIKHMWPLTIMPPRYKESMVLTFVDKYCAVAEVIYQSYMTVLGKSLFLIKLNSGGVFVK